MTTQIDYNKLLKKIAKERLKPYGIFQQGQSRTFLYDRGWFTIVIEFQPSSWSKGTYLNIGVDFNFYPRDYFAFGYGYREKGFEEFKNEEQFNKLVNELCELTIKRVQELEQKFIDIWTALKTADKEKADDTWRIYEVAVLNILTSNFDKARKQLFQVSKSKCEYDWEIERKKVADELIDWLQERPTNLDKIKNLITETRQLKKLPTITLDNLTQRKTTLNSTYPQTVSSNLMTIEQARQKILTTINSDKESVDRYFIDDKNIVDHDFAWYIPFLKETPTNEIYAGAWNGFFVDKSNGEMFRPGSGLPLERWLVGFKIGLRYDKYDLHILKTKDKNETIQFLKQLNLQYYIEEPEGGTTWKIPKSFSDKMILERLQNLPAVFRNQRLTFSIDTFEKIIQTGIFEFKLESNISEDNAIGENLTRNGSS